MQTFPAQYVFPPPPVLLLVFVVVGFVIWAVARAIIDARTWFEDEILDDDRDPAKNSGEPRLKERLVFLVVLLVAWAVVSVIDYARTWF